MATNRDANIRFFDRWSWFYDYDPVSWWLRWVQRKVLKQVVVGEKTRLLDVGCGPGRALWFFVKKGVKILAGIDLSSKMVARAKGRLGNSVILKVASVDKIPFPKNTFDVVTNTEAFHHFPVPQRAVNEMSRVLRPNGKLYLADINFFSKTIHWLFKKLELGHVKIYSKKEFAELFLKAGLKVVVQRRVGLFVILTVGKKLA
ncbi:class I SAM-dependent methyltransferase [Candidatus Woesearchaeota archaeon]|nr:class I SAM-dependent methyltransferase [Candidatus Woesearchaeota archaeon]